MILWAAMEIKTVRKIQKATATQTAGVKLLLGLQGLREDSRERRVPIAQTARYA